MRVVSWNLNHKAVPKKIPEGLGELFLQLGADVVFLNEFVDRPNGMRFRLELFAAARLPFRKGDIPAPNLNTHAISNFLHIKFADPTIELVGLRAPTFDTK